MLKLYTVERGGLRRSPTPAPWSAASSSASYCFPAPGSGSTTRSDPSGSCSSRRLCGVFGAVC